MILDIHTHIFPDHLADRTIKKLRSLLETELFDLLWDGSETQRQSNASWHQTKIELDGRAIRSHAQVFVINRRSFYHPLICQVSKQETDTY